MKEMSQGYEPSTLAKTATLYQISYPLQIKQAQFIKTITFNLDF